MTYLLTCLLTYLLACLLTYVLTYLRTYLLSYLLAYLLTHFSSFYVLTYLPFCLFTCLLTDLLTALLTYVLTDLRTYVLTCLHSYMLRYLPLYLHNLKLMKELPCELCAPAKSCAGDVPATPFLLQAGQGKQEVGIFRMFFKTWRTKKGHLPWPSSFSCLSSGFGLPCQWQKNRQEKPALCDMVSEGNRIQFFVPSEDY